MRHLRKWLHRALWGGTFASGLFALFQLHLGLYLADSAPQQAAAAGMAVAYAAIPYIIARGFDELLSP